jgi:hypothetical protein
MIHGEHVMVVEELAKVAARHGLTTVELNVNGAVYKFDRLPFAPPEADAPPEVTDAEKLMQGLVNADKAKERRDGNAR